MLSLAPREVHVWSMMTSVVPSSEAARRCEHLLSPEERERRARFYFAIDRLEFTLTRGLIRTLLTWYLGGDPAGWRFTATDHGKPVLAMVPATGRFTSTCRTRAGSS